VEKARTPERQYPRTGVYEHYKSTDEDKRYYQVLGFAKHTETGEILAVYIPLYVDSEPTGLLDVRPLAMFTEDVVHNGQVVPRYRYIGPELQF